MGCHFLLQGIVPTQGSTEYLLWLLHWQVDSLPLRHLGIPNVIKEAATTPTTKQMGRAEGPVIIAGGQA